jgi:hypothetical protein
MKDSFDKLVAGYKTMFDREWEETAQAVRKEGVQLGKPNPILIETYAGGHPLSGKVLLDLAEDEKDPLYEVGAFLANSTGADGWHVTPERLLFVQARDRAAEYLEPDDPEEGDLCGALYDLDIILAAWPTSPFDNILERVHRVIFSQPLS